MNNKIFILNASPIILLGKAGLLKTISPLAESWIVPEGVVAEVEAKRSIDSYLSDLAKASNVSRSFVEHIHPSIATWDLGQGESEVLTLAMQQANAEVVLDDLQARKCAGLFKIPLVGSLGLLVMAKRNGHIYAARPELEKLIKAGLRIDLAMLDRIYKKIGE
jgi:predicted nucleic acid-binding protein